MSSYSSLTTLKTFHNFSYKIVIGVSDPVGNELELRDLKPYTRYHLDLRSRFGNKENWGSIDFSTAGKIHML